MGQRLCYLVTWSISDCGQEEPFKYMSYCPSFPIILNIVAPLSPFLTPFYPSFLPHLPLIDTPLSFFGFSSFHSSSPLSPHLMSFTDCLAPEKVAGFLLASSMSEEGRSSFRRAPVNSNKPKSLLIRSWKCNRS